MVSSFIARELSHRNLNNIVKSRETKNRSLSDSISLTVETSYTTDLQISLDAGRGLNSSKNTSMPSYPDSRHRYYETISSC